MFSELIRLENSRQKSRLASHRNAIRGHRIEQALLNAQPISKNENVAYRSKNRGDPCSVDKRESNQLNEYAEIIRMTYPAKRPITDNAETRRIHDLRIPMDSERTNHPPSQRGC